MRRAYVNRACSRRVPGTTVWWHDDVVVVAAPVPWIPAYAGKTVRWFLRSPLGRGGVIVLPGPTRVTGPSFDSPAQAGIRKDRRVGWQSLLPTLPTARHDKSYESLLNRHK